MWLKLVFCSKGMKRIETIKTPFFYVIPVNNVDNSLTPR